MFTSVLPQNHLITAATHLSMDNPLRTIKDEGRGHIWYRKALFIYTQYYDEESPEIQDCYANINAFNFSNQAKKIFRRPFHVKRCIENSCEAVEKLNEEDLASHYIQYSLWKQHVDESANISTIGSDIVQHLGNEND
jgi:hypothetical protein